MDILQDFYKVSAFDALSLKMVVMWLVVLVLFYLAIYKKFEPLLLVPIAFGALIANLPTKGIVNEPPGDVIIQESGVIVEMEVANGSDVEEGESLFKIRSEHDSSVVESGCMRPVLAELRIFQFLSVPRFTKENSVSGFMILLGEVDCSTTFNRGVIWKYFRHSYS